MVRILSDPKTAHVLGEAGRDLVCRRFSVEGMVRGYEKLIDGIYRAAREGKRLTPEQFDGTMEAELDRITAERAAEGVASR